MTLTELRKIFQEHYFDGFIYPGKYYWRAVQARWLVSYDGLRIYRYDCTLRSVLEHILSGIISQEEWDSFNDEKEASDEYQTLSPVDEKTIFAWRDR